jgi:hypothetical protein
VAEEYKTIVDGEYTNNAVFSSEHCPTTSSFRHCPKKQITHGDKFRAEQTVNAQIAWAAQVGRQDKSDAEWAALTAAVEDPNLDSFEILIAQIERAATPDGRCEKALRRWLQHRGTWAGGKSYRGRSWLWNLETILPRYFVATEMWYQSRTHAYDHHAIASIWSTRGANNLLKGRVTNKTNRYGLPKYCDRASDAISAILYLLLQFYDVADGEDCKPTVVMVSSIVLGRAAACLLQSVRDSAAPKEAATVFSRALESFGDKGPETCHSFAKQYDIVFAVFTSRGRAPYTKGRCARVKDFL